MKKFLSILLSLLIALSCCAVGVFAAAEEPAEPEVPKTDSGYYVGQILAPGDKITSVHEECDILSVTYSVSMEDRESVTSELQKKYSDPEFIGVVSFRDVISGFTSGDTYNGSYTVLGGGDTVSEMETKNTEFHTAAEIFSSLTKDEQKKLKDGITLTIDYTYAKTTLKNYTSITGWKVTAVTESVSALTLSLQAVFETREPTGFETVLEALYVRWLAFLDVLGDTLTPIVPKLIEAFAAMLSKTN